jgi:S1-C subfamily serine protease
MLRVAGAENCFSGNYMFGRIKMQTSGFESGSSLLAFSNDLASTVERAGASIVGIGGQHQRGLASGVYWREGVIVTAAHAVGRQEEVAVTLPDKSTVTATLAGRDASTDIAALRLKDSFEISVANISDAAAVKAGNVALAVGRTKERGVSASLCIISMASGAWRTWRGGEIDQFIRLDTALYPGFTGSALIDASGRVIGINTPALSRGAGIVVPAQTVNRVVDELLTRGRIARGFIGVALHPVRVPDSLKNKLNVTAESGLIVLSIEPAGPADRAGLLIGDILLGIDGHAVTDTEDVQKALRPERVGTEIATSIIRGGALAEVKIIVGERPPRRRR